MAERISKQNTYVFFIDNEDSYINDILSKFDEVNNYHFKIYSRSKEFFEDFIQIDHSKKKIFIVFISDNLEYDEDNNQVNVLDLLKRIKEINSSAEVILYSENDNIDLVSSAFHFGAYTFIKKNENIILRIENNIKGIISQKNFLLKKESSRFFTLFFLIFIVSAALLVVTFYFLFPNWFY